MPYFLQGMQSQQNESGFCMEGKKEVPTIDVKLSQQFLKGKFWECPEYGEVDRRWRMGMIGVYSGSIFRVSPVPTDAFVTYLTLGDVLD